MPFGVTYCPNLKFFASMQFTFTKIQKHYGPKVQKVSLGSALGPRACIKLLETCPNARFLSKLASEARGLIF